MVNRRNVQRKEAQNTEDKFESERARNDDSRLVGTLHDEGTPKVIVKVSETPES